MRVAGSGNWPDSGIASAVLKRRTSNSAFTIFATRTGLYQFNSDLAADDRRGALKARQRNVIFGIEQPIQL